MSIDPKASGVLELAETQPIDIAAIIAAQSARPDATQAGHGG